MTVRSAQPEAPPVLPRAPGGRTGPGWGRSARRRLARLTVALVVAGVVVPLAGAAALWPLTPAVGDAEQRITARLEQHQARDPNVLGEPDKVGVAVVATEDSRFLSHHGLDAVGVLRAGWTTLQGSQRDAGGATLDQQIAKNLYTADTMSAKVEQIELSFKLEAEYSKPQILEMYLAEVYFGHGFYGLPAAARGLFGVAPTDLSWGQASLLAGLVQAPSAYDPYQHQDLAKQRQRHVLERFVATHILSPAQADAAYADPLGLR